MPVDLTRAHNDDDDDDDDDDELDEEEEEYDDDNETGVLELEGSVESNRQEIITKLLPQKDDGLKESSAPLSGPLGRAYVLMFINQNGFRVPQIRHVPNEQSGDFCGGSELHKFLTPRQPLFNEGEKGKVLRDRLGKLYVFNADLMRNGLVRFNYLSPSDSASDAIALEQDGEFVFSAPKGAREFSLAAHGSAQRFSVPNEAYSVRFATSRRSEQKPDTDKTVCAHIRPLLAERKARRVAAPAMVTRSRAQRSSSRP